MQENQIFFYKYNARKSYGARNFKILHLEVNTYINTNSF